MLPFHSLHLFLTFLGSVTHYLFDSHRRPSCLNSALKLAIQVGSLILALLVCETAWFVSQSINYMVFSKLCFVISLMLFKLHGTYSAFAKSFQWINISTTYCFTLAIELLQFVGKIEQRPDFPHLLCKMSNVLAGLLPLTQRPWLVLCSGSALSLSVLRKDL